LTVLYLTHGFSPSTSVAVVGTLVALALTGALSALAVSAMHLTGVTDDLSTALGQSYSVNLEGLLLAGIVIGSLGVLDDVTVTQAATVAEIARA
ncbi:YibE/F family protein, partial [Salmonella sp. s57402]